MLSCLDTVIHHAGMAKIKHENLQRDFGVQMAQNINSDRGKPIITWGSLTNICHKNCGTSSKAYLVLECKKRQWKLHDTKTHL